MNDAPISPRLAISCVFAAFGVVMGLWGGALPEVARAAKVDAQAIGAAFFAFSVAGILAFVVSGRIGGRVSLKRRLLILLALAAACVFALFHARSGAALTAGLFVFAFLTSSVDLVMNSEAVAVERDEGRPVLSGFHGLASFGVAGGAISGSLLSAGLGLTATACVALAICAAACLAVFIGTPDRGPTRPEGSAAWFRPGAALIALSVILGASISTEIAAVMFSAKALAEQAPNLIAWAGAGGAAFALCQAGLRMGGDGLRARLGDRALIRLSLAGALIGLLIVSVSPAFPVTVLGFAIIGLGTACIVPCGFAFAAGLSHHPATAVISMALIIGGLIRVPSPMIYGMVAERTGFTYAFGVYALFVAAATAIAWTMFAAPYRRRTT